MASLLAFLVCSHVSAQREFTLGVRGGLLSGGLRDEMFSPLNYSKTGFTAGLDGEYRVGKSQIAFGLGYDQAQAKSSGATDYFNADFYGIRIGAAYLHAVWPPSSRFRLWCGGGYRFGLEGVIWEMQAYTYIASHTFEPVVKLEWDMGRRHLVSSRISAYLLGFIARPPYNYLPEYDEKLRRSYFSYLIRELGHTKFATVGRHWDVDATLAYHYRIGGRVLLGAQYGFRYQRYRAAEPISQYDNTLALSVKVRL